MNIQQRKSYIKNFGMIFSLRTFLLQKIANKSKGEKQIKKFDKLNEIKLKKLEENFVPFINEEYKKYQIKNNKMNKKYIWVFWMQENYKEIPIVNLCIESIKNNKPKDAEVIIINKNNLLKYADISKNIMKKYEKGLISVTHLSDILRMNLLNKYGGVWFDATIYTTQKYDFTLECDFWTCKRKNNNSIYISKAKWTGFAIGGKKGLIIFYLMNKLFEKYWEEYDVLIDFFLIDYFMELLYRNVDEIKNIIDNNNYNNENIHKLWNNLSNKYNENEWNNITNDTSIFKLSWRIPQKEYIDNEETFYHHILKNGGNNEC